MSLFDRFRDRLVGPRTAATAKPTSAAAAAAAMRGPRVQGYPASSNKASSMHLQWLMPGGAHDAGAVVEIGATLEILVPPAVRALYFWALQGSFVDDAGISHGGAHLGLQWHPDHPGSTAANWGGYKSGGGELAGTESLLPSARQNPNTRDFRWEPGRPYRLTIRRTDDGLWGGYVDSTELRRLQVGGNQLINMVVWSEVFARCNDPSVTIRWSRFEARTERGVVVPPERVHVNYQSHAEGGCDNTTARPTSAGILQVTNAAREVPGAAVIPAAPAGP